MRQKSAENLLQCNSDASVFFCLAALAHQNDFDVCWPRGSIAETIFTPMVERIQSAGGQVREGHN
jgi:hypothetical protein